MAVGDRDPLKPFMPSAVKMVEDNWPPYWPKFSYSELARRCGATRPRCYEWRVGAKGPSKLQLLRLVNMMIELDVFSEWFSEVEKGCEKPGAVSRIGSLTERSITLDAWAAGERRPLNDWRF